MVGLNKVIKVLIASDFLLQSGWGLVGPIFAIFLTQQIQGGSLVMVGFIASAYWLVKSIVQPFIAHSFDVKKGEKDDFTFLIWGMCVANLIPLGYIFSTQVWHILLLEFVRGLAMACVIPSWYAIFTRHIDNDREAFSWSIESTSIGLAAGFASALGGLIAATIGFKAVFVLVTMFGLGASFTLLLIRNKLFSRSRFLPRLPSSDKPL